MQLQEICTNLRKHLENSVKNNLSNGMLFSGGLDTSIIAAITSKQIPLKAITVAFKPAPTIDIDYARLMARHLQIEHEVHFFDEKELLDAIEKTIEIMHSFDPMEIRNSAAIYVGFKRAKERGFTAISTGDGADELFGGYSFFFNKTEKELEIELKKIAKIMHFSSTPIGKSFGIEAKLPYLDPELKKFALEIPARYKIFKEKGKTWGKWILRKAFEDLLPAEITWREKTPIEQGSGTFTLPELFNKKMTDEEFNEKKEVHLKRDGVKIRDKEQLHYYEIFRKIHGVPHPTDSKERKCPHCNSNLHPDSNFCKICGFFQA
jgi:asparagine synthase (glutamine-hydrolysing)